MREMIYSAQGINDLLSTIEYSPNKALGQNFLIDQHAVDAILCAACIDGRSVLEIGSGLGALTFPLNDRAKHVTTVDIDERLVSLLKTNISDFTCRDTLCVVCRDFLKLDMGDIYSGINDFAVVANLPYYITTPICMKLLAEADRIGSMTLMMQAEAAMRFFAQPSDTQYGPLTIAAQYMFTTKRVLKLSPQSYYPQPDVDSVVLHMERREFESDTAFKLRKILGPCFSMRRKTLVNNLMTAGYDRNTVENALNEIGLNVKIRAEAMSLDDFLRLIDALQ